MTSPAKSQGHTTGVLSASINPEAPVLTSFSETRSCYEAYYGPFKKVLFLEVEPFAFHSLLRIRLKAIPFGECWVEILPSYGLRRRPVWTLFLNKHIHAKCIGVYSYKAMSILFIIKLMIC